jgi:hypothetical protein
MPASPGPTTILILPESRGSRPPITRIMGGPQPRHLRASSPTAISRSITVPIRFNLVRAAPFSGRQEPGIAVAATGDPLGRDKAAHHRIEPRTDADATAADRDASFPQHSLWQYSHSTVSGNRAARLSRESEPTDSAHRRAGEIAPGGRISRGAPDRFISIGSSSAVPKPISLARTPGFSAV